MPGVPLIGPKIARELLEKYGTLEGVLEHADEVSGAKRRQNLMEGRELAVEPETGAAGGRRPVEFDLRRGHVGGIERGRGQGDLRGVRLSWFGRRVSHLDVGEAPKAAIEVPHDRHGRAVAATGRRSFEPREPGLRYGNHPSPTRGGPRSSATRSPRGTAKPATCRCAGRGRTRLDPQTVADALRPSWKTRHREDRAEPEIRHRGCRGAGIELAGRGLRHDGRQLPARRRRAEPQPRRPGQALSGPHHDQDHRTDRHRQEPEADGRGARRPVADYAARRRRRALAADGDPGPAAGGRRAWTRCSTTWRCR